MEAFSPGVGNHSRKEKTGNTPSTERKKHNREFNRVMKVGKNIKKENKGMYALDEIKLSYAEAVQIDPKPSNLSKQRSNDTCSVKVKSKFNPRLITNITPSPILNSRTINPKY